MYRYQIHILSRGKVVALIPFWIFGLTYILLIDWMDTSRKHCSVPASTPSIVATKDLLERRNIVAF
jgi:hypothetical protein